MAVAALQHVEHAAYARGPQLNKQWRANLHHIVAAQPRQQSTVEACIQQCPAQLAAAAAQIDITLCIEPLCAGRRHGDVMAQLTKTVAERPVIITEITYQQYFHNSLRCFTAYAMPCKA